MRDVIVPGPSRTDEAPEPQRDLVNAVLDTVGALVVVLDAEGRIVRFNRACEQTTGYLFAEVEGRAVWDFLLMPAEVDQVKRVFAQLQAGQFPNEHENLWVTKDGSQRLIAWSNTALPGEDGSVEYVIGTGIDVTDQRRAEEETDRLLAQVMAEQGVAEVLSQDLQQERDTLQTIMDNTRAQVAYLDAQFRFVRVNAAYEQGSGHRREELLGRNLFKLFPNPENQAIFEQVRDTGESVEYRAKPFEFADQPERAVTHWDWTLAPVKDEDGMVQGLVLSLEDVTERVQAAQERERLLAEAHRQRQAAEETNWLLQALIETMPAGAIISDAEGNLLQTNAAGQAILGGTVRGTVATPERPYSTHYPDGTPLPLEDLPLMHALKEGRVIRDIEVLIRRADGDERIILAGAAPVLGDGGKILSGIAIFQDITELMEAQRALRDSEQKLGKLFEILPVGISVLDQSRNVVKANPALSSILDLSADELRYGSHRRRRYLTADGEACPPQDLPSARAFDEQRALQDVEIGIVKEDGEVVWTSVSAVPVPFPDWQVVVVTTDVSERKRAEEALRRERDFTAAILDTSGGLVVVLDRKGRIVRFNHACEQTTGYRFEEVRGKPFWELLLIPEEVEPVKAVFAQLQAGQAPNSFENYWVAKDGSRRWIAWSNTALTGESGSIEYVIGTGIDITERRRAEEDLQETLEKSRQRQAEVSALLKGARQVLAQQKFEDTARSIFDTCKDLTGASAGYVALTNKDGTANELLFLDSGPYPCTVDPALPMPIRGLRGQVYQTGTVAYENDFRASPWAKLLPKGHVGVHNLLFAPLIIGDEVVGLLGLANKPGGFDENDASVATAFGELVAIALHNSRLMESLEASELRFRSVVETANVAIVTADSQGQITFWNRMAETIFGYTAQEIAGRPLTQIIPGPFRTAHEAGMQRVLSTGKSRLAGETVETIGLRKNGDELPLEMSLATWKIGEEPFFTALMHDIARRKQFEEALREANQSLQALIKASPLATIAVDLDLSVRLWNPAAERMFGWSESEILGQPYPLIPDNRQEEFRGFLAQVLAGQALSARETVRERKDGSSIDVSIWTAALHDAQGTINNILAIIADISERKQAEAALRRHADEQNALYTITSAVAATLDQEELLPVILEAVLPALGADVGWIFLPGPLSGDPPRLVAQWDTSEERLVPEVILPVKDCPIYQNLPIDDAAEAEPRQVVDCPVPASEASDGSELGTLVCVPLCVGPTVLGVLKIGWRQPYPHLERSQGLLSTIGRQVGVALHHAKLYEAARQVDRLSMLSELDRALVATLDLRKLAEVTLTHLQAHLEAPTASILLLPVPGLAQARGLLFSPAQGWTEVGISREDTGHWLAFLERLAEQRGSMPCSVEALEPIISQDLQLARLEGAHALVVPIRGEQDLFAVLALCWGADRPVAGEEQALAEVAARHAGQAMENAQLYDDLRDVIGEHERTRAQLIQSEKLAALGRLAASVAHEINNPLQAIENYLTLVHEEMHGSQRRDKLDRYLEVVGGEVGRISAIVRRMRDYYRPAHERLQPTDVLGVLNSVLELSEKELQHRRIKVERQGSHELPLIHANPDHLKQVFLNLILNAMDAMPTGGKLCISTTTPEAQLGEENRPQSAVRVDVSDTGHGIPPEIQARLFEPFFTTKEHGAGLGLSITYNIIEAHNGQISVRSEEGVGTTFSILLPIAPL